MVHLVGQIQMGEVAVGIRAQGLIIGAKTLETSIMVAWVQLMRTAATVCCTNSEALYETNNLAESNFNKFSNTAWSIISCFTANTWIQEFI